MKKISLFILILAVTLSSCAKPKTVSDLDEKGKYILPERQVKLTVWNLDDFEDEKAKETDVVAKTLKEKTNVSVNKMFDNNGKHWTDRLAQLVMDGQLPHMVNTVGSEGMHQFLKLDKIKKLYRLSEEEIKAYAPEVFKKVPEKYWDYLKNENGDILGIPYLLPPEDAAVLKNSEAKDYIKNNYVSYENGIYPQKGKCLWIRDDILKEFYPEAKSWEEIQNLEADGEALLDVPIATSEEFIHFMYDISSKEYKDSTGKDVYAFGYTGEDGADSALMLGADMFGYKNHNLYTSWQGDKINFILDDEIIYKSFKAQNEMIYDGVINGESIEDTEKEYINKVLRGKYAIIAPENGEEINEMLARNAAAFRYRPFLTNIKSEYEIYKSEQIWGGAVCLLNTLNKSEAHQVLNWINYQYSDEFDCLLSWGTEDMYTETEEGKYLFKNDALNKYFILGDESAILDKAELCGIGGGFYITATGVSKYTPQVMYKSNVKGRLDFSPSSERVAGLKTKPISDIKSSVYAGIPEVSEFVGKLNNTNRELMRVLSRNKDDFDENWAGFIKSVRGISDIGLIEEKMTNKALGR